MDGQNMDNNQNNQGTGNAQFSNYQDNTANIPYQNPVEPAGPSSPNTLQIVSLVLGIAGIVLGCCISYLGVILGIAGLLCAVFGNKEGKTGVGTAGFVCSIVALVLGIIWVIVGLVFGAALLSELSNMGYTY